MTKDQENYESLLTEDEYLAPNAPIIMDRKRKNSSSTISSQSTNYSLRDGDSPIGTSRSLSSQTLSHSSITGFDSDYQPFLEIRPKEESISVNENTEENYEIVNENQTNDMLTISQRPPLPKVKETPITISKTKRIADVFPNLQNWSKNPKDKKNTKDKHDFDHNIEDNTSDPINNNNNNSGKSLIYFIFHLMTFESDLKILSIISNLIIGQKLQLFLLISQYRIH